jgi:hypothetical protein
LLKEKNANAFVVHGLLELFRAVHSQSAGFATRGARDIRCPHHERRRRIEQAIRLSGSSQLWPAKKLLSSLDWWKLEPQRERLRLNGAPNPPPTATDISAPHAAVVPGNAVVIYLPRGNAGRDVTLDSPLGDAIAKAGGRRLDGFGRAGSLGVDRARQSTRCSVF